jgi:hypothetical protein
MRNMEQDSSPHRSYQSLKDFCLSNNEAIHGRKPVDGQMFEGGLRLSPDIVQY